MAGRWGGGCGGHRGAAGTGGTAHTGGAPRTGGTAQRERYGWDFVRRGGTVRRGGSALGAVVERGYRAAGVRCAGGTGGWAWLRVPLDGGEQSGEGVALGFVPGGVPEVWAPPVAAVLGVPAECTDAHAYVRVSVCVCVCVCVKSFPTQILFKMV